MAQGAEKRVMSGTDHDADVSGPNDEISGLGMLHPSKMVAASIQAGRVRISVREPGAYVDGMNQVGAIDARGPA